MKRIFALVLAVLLLASVSSSFADNYSDVGIAVDVPENLNRNISISSEAIPESGILYFEIAYYNVQALEQQLEGYKEKAMALAADDEAGFQALTEEITLILAANCYFYGAIYGFDNTVYSAGDVSEILGDAVKLDSRKQYDYYLLDTGSANDRTNDETRIAAEAELDTAKAILASLTLIDIEEKAENPDAGIPEFTTTDLNGNTVTRDIFAQADLTVLNIWGTFCSPCVNEMPELAAWAAELPSNVQIVGLMIDVDSPASRTFKTAQKIVDKTGVNYTNLLICDELAAYFDEIAGVPTTMFFDRNGHQVAEPIVGAYVAGYKNTVKLFLEH